LAVEAKPPGSKLVACDSARILACVTLMVEAVVDGLRISHAVYGGGEPG
jgi:hypothetical protein